MKKLKLYIAGKVNPESVFGTHNWRDNFCKEISEKSGYEIINLDPTKSSDNFELNEKDDQLIYGRDCFMIQSADLVIVNLTDDISVGGSQEMLIAKYFGKPLIGLAPKGCKFNVAEKIIYGNKYNDYVNPFISIPCDEVVENIDEIVEVLKTKLDILLKNPKTINVLDDAINYYKLNFFDKDTILHDK